MVQRERVREPILFPGRGRVKQEFRDESDVNTILARWRKTGILPSGEARTPMYGDFSNSDDYLEASNKVIAADEAFRALPATIRSRFDHNPSELIAFMSDPENEDEARSMGVIPPLPEAPPVVESPETEPAAEPDPMPDQ